MSKQKMREMSKRLVQMQVVLLERKANAPSYMNFEI